VKNLFELKYYKKSKPKDRETKIKEGKEQIEGYLKIKEIMELESLRSYLIISDGREVEVFEVI